MAAGKSGKIFIGVGGWTFEPWRGTFYPEKLTQKRELEYAASKLTSIEINGTYYGSQKPESFAKWHDETPDNFVFAVKGSRYITNRKVLGEAGDSMERFFSSGLSELKTKLGPINWQFMATKKFDPDDFEAFLKLLPKTLDGLPMRHAVEVRHESFKTPEFVALARKYEVAIILGADADFPKIADVTAPFVYIRAMGSSEEHTLGYAPQQLDLWTQRARDLAAGKPAEGLELLAEAAKATPRDVYLYVISGFKERNPAAAMALIKRLDAAE